MSADYRRRTVGYPGMTMRVAIITSAQLLALNAAPQVIVPKPKTGWVNILNGIEIYKAAGTAYSGVAAGEDLAVKYTDENGLQVASCETTGFLDQATAQTRWVRRYHAASADSGIAPVLNAALVLHLLTGEVTTGNSPLRLRIFYGVVKGSF